MATPTISLDDPTLRPGASDTVLLVVSIIGFITLGILVQRIVLLKLDPGGAGGGQLGGPEIDADGREVPYEMRLIQTDPSVLSRAQRRARAKIIGKLERQQQVHGMLPPDEPLGDAVAEFDEQPVGDDGIDEDDASFIQNHPVDSRSRKERKMAARQTELEARRLGQQGHKAHQRHDSERSKRERVEKEKELKIRQRKIQREQAELLEYERGFKRFIGNLDVSAWVEELKVTPVADLRRLSEEYNVSIPSITKRIEILLLQRRLSGVFLNQNRFLYLTGAQLQGIANRVMDSGEPLTTKAIEKIVFETTDVSLGA